MPADDQLRKLYEAAHASRLEGTIDASLRERYGGKVGALLYVAPGCRADVAAACGLLARALTFPTVELEACADCLRR